MKRINKLFVRNIPKLSGIREYLVRKQPVRRKTVPYNKSELKERRGDITW